jgi:3D (Asp-Asp-Asp) domain-containing protein
MKWKSAFLSVTLLPMLFGAESQPKEVKNAPEMRIVRNPVEDSLSTIQLQIEKQKIMQMVKKKEELEKQQQKTKKEDLRSKGTHIKMVVTGYTAGPESTGKRPGDPGYGITKCQNKVEKGVTIAAGDNIPCGTKVYIPYFEGKEGFDDGVFTVQDRGSAIGPYDIDVYFEELDDALNFGVKLLDVYILPKED